MKKLFICMTFALASISIANASGKECANSQIDVKNDMVEHRDGANTYHIDSQSVILKLPAEQSGCGYAASGMPSFFNTSISVEKVKYSIAGKSVTETVLCTEKSLIIGTDCKK